MPHIEVKMFPGRDEETKKKFADEVIKAASDSLGTPAGAFSVSIEEVLPEKWNKEVADVACEKKIYSGKVFRN